MKHNPHLLCNLYNTQITRTTGKPMASFITYNHGWYTTYTNKKFRANQLIQSINQLMTLQTAIPNYQMVNNKKTWIPADKHVVKSLINNKDVIECKDTPHGCSVASETYWSM